MNEIWVSLQRESTTVMKAMSKTTGRLRWAH